MNSEIQASISIVKTNKIIYQCLGCKKISIYYSRSSDGKTCAFCEGQITPLGYAKNDVNVTQLPKKLQASESEEQIALFQWATLYAKKFPELELLYHIPNGGKRHKSTAVRLKAEGVKAGVPDICLPVPKGNYHGLYIELKAGKNTTTDNQNRWLQVLKANGYDTAVCYGWETASRVILKYLNGVVVNAE